MMTFDWHQQALADLEQLWRDGKSFSQIAAILSARYGLLSRNAVIGKAHRMGLHQGAESRATCVAKAKPVKESRPRRRRPWKPVIVPKKAPAIEERDKTSELVDTKSNLDPSAIPTSQRKSLLQLRPGDCRFPYGEVGQDGFFFCGGDQETGSSYCSFHRRVTQNPRAPRITDEERERRRALGRQMTRHNFQARRSSI